MVHKKLGVSPDLPQPSQAIPEPHRPPELCTILVSRASRMSLQEARRTDPNRPEPNRFAIRTVANRTDCEPNRTEPIEIKNRTEPNRTDSAVNRTGPEPFEAWNRSSLQISEAKPLLPPPGQHLPPTFSLHQHLPTFTARREHFWHSEVILGAMMAHTCPQSAPHEPQLAQNGAPGELLDPYRVARSSKNLQKHKSNYCFYDVHKIALGCLRDALFGPRGLQMSPQVAKSRVKGLNRSPFGFLFRFFFVLFRPWIPDGVRKGARAPSSTPKWAKNDKKSTPGHQHRL